MESPSKVVAKSANTLAEIESTTDETEEVEEFVDAMDVSFGSESYIYDANVQIVDIKDDNIDDQKEMALTDIALMLCSTLASEYDGASVPRNDWNIRLDVRSVELGFADFEALLKSENVEHFVEQAALIKGVPYYRAVCFPLTEHILRRVAECKLEEYQKAEKRKKKRMMDLKNPENEENFIEGKRRILNILLDLKAYETDVDYQKIRDEYMKRYNTSLNAAEQQRLFLNRSAMKNFWRAFHREVILTNDNPIHLRLRSQDIKIPDEITEEDRRLVANIDNIELPKFDLPYRSPVSYLGRKAFLAEHLESIVSQDGDACCQKEAKISMPTMDWGEEVEEEDEMKTNAEGECASTFEKICIANKTLYDDDKYTGDEESTDSSDSKMDAFGQYRKKKIKTRINTFNIPSKSSTSHPSLAKRLPVAGRSLELSLNYLNMKQSNLSGALASDTFNDRNSTATFQQTSYSSSQPPKLNQRRIKYCCGTAASKNLCVDHSGPAVVDLSDEEQDEQSRIPAFFEFCESNNMSRDLHCGLKSVA